MATEHIFIREFVDHKALQVSAYLHFKKYS